MRGTAKRKHFVSKWQGGDNPTAMIRSRHRLAARLKTHEKEFVLICKHKLNKLITYTADHLWGGLLSNLAVRLVGQEVPLVILLLVGQNHTRLRPVDFLELGHQEDDGSGADEYHLGR